MRSATIREAVGVFHAETSLHSAVDALLVSGFDRSCLSLLADRHALDAASGCRHKRVIDLEDDPAVPKRACVGTDSRTEGEAAIVGGLFYLGAMVTTVVVASDGTAAGGRLPAPTAYVS